MTRANIVNVAENFEFVFTKNRSSNELNRIFFVETSALATNNVSPKESQGRSNELDQTNVERVPAGGHRNVDLPRLYKRVDCLYKSCAVVIGYLVPVIVTVVICVHREAIYSQYELAP
jgi:hypothetical protein